MGLFFQCKQHTKIKMKMYGAPPTETDFGVLKENIGHGWNKLFNISANSCSWRYFKDSNLCKDEFRNSTVCDVGSNPYHFIWLSYP